MSQSIVKKVSTSRERKQFLRLPWELYRDDPNWVPPLRSLQKEMVGYSYNPFYDRNRVQTFLAYRGDEVCGRIAAILNYGHNNRFDERRGFFGFFECIDDQPTANLLFDAVRDWFADQGIHSLRGPTNPSLNHEVGLLVDGFDSPPTFMMTYNPSYYARLIEEYGFQKTQDLYAFTGHLDQLPAIVEKLGPIADQIMERFEVKFRALEKARFLETVREFLSVYNRSLVNTWGFVPMTDAELRHAAKGLRHLIVPELTIGAEINGELIGAAFGLPDFNPQIKHIDGRLFPFGFMHLLRQKQKIKKVRLISTNVIPAYQRTGVGLALMAGLLPKGLALEYEEVEFSWVLESNSLSRGALKKGGAKISKTFRLYDWEAEPKPEGGPDAQERPAATSTAMVCRAGAAAVGGQLEVRPVRTSRDLDQFCKVPWRIYADDPQWVPPLLMEVKEFLNPRKHPFLRHGTATQFLATRDGVPVGRILVSDDPHYNKHHDANVGCFGMFECVDDPETAYALLDAGADWLHARGRSTVMGPIDYSTNYPTGLLVDGFDTPPRIMMNHHRPYYANLLESWGLTKAKDLYSWWFLDPKDLGSHWRKRLERLERRSRITIRPMRLGEFDVETERGRIIYNGSMQNNWGSVPLTEAEFRHLADGIKQLTLPELVMVAEVRGEPVGFTVVVPDLNEAILPLDGRLMKYGLPINAARLKYRLKRVKTVRMIALGILEGYRRRGIAELLILRVLDYGKNHCGFTGAELGWTLEDNDQVNHPIETVGARRYKTYRVYEKSLS